MPSTILSRTFSTVEDKRIVLSNSQFARPFNITTWATLRIALRLNMNNTGAHMASPNRFYVGLSSGTTNLIMDATTDNWCGVASDNAMWYWYYASPTTAEYYNFGMRATKRVGSTITDNATDICGGSFSISADSSVADRCLLFVDITKGSPNYTFNVVLFRQLDSYAGDASYADYCNLLELTTPSWTHHLNGTPKTLAVDESTGTFNCVNIGWNHTTPTIELSDLAIIKLA